MKKLNENFLTALVIIIMILGVSIKSQAQDFKVGFDNEKAKNSMKLNLNNSEYSILIPKVKLEQLSSAEGVDMGQMVYVTDQKVGFYQFTDNSWNKINITQAMQTVKDNLELLTPSNENVIMVASNTGHPTKHMLDYNGHVSSVNTTLNGNEVADNYAVRLND